MLAPWYRSPGFLASAFIVVMGIAGASFYANLSYDLDDPKELAWFPPFKEGYDNNHNDHAGAEYFKIATALYAGRGYSDPFGAGTGATAWMPPLLPLFEWLVLETYGGNRDAPRNAMIITQTAAFIFTGLLVLFAARRTAPAVPSPLLLPLMAAALAARFHLSFQQTHDTGLVMIALDLVLIGAVWGGALESRWRKALWGIVGGLVMLANPIVGVCWGVVTLGEAARLRSLRSAILSVTVAAAVMSPWVVRNAVVFHRFIPVKSNLAYELYQSQVHTSDGRLTSKVFGTHPNSRSTAERIEYSQKGEMAFLDAKRTAFWATVRENPRLFAWKIWNRVLAVTVDYSPMVPEEYERRTLFVFCYLTLPFWFFAAAGLSALLRIVPMPRGAAMSLALLACYLAPYAIVSYYERYETPAWGLKILVIACWLEAMIRGVRGFLGYPRRESGPADIFSKKVESATPQQAG